MQCYLMDDEMFLGEQRFVQEDVRKFMEFFRLQMDDVDNIKVQESVKGAHAKIRAGDKFLAQEEDPDAEINKDMIIQEESSESSSEESSESSEYSDSDVEQENVSKDKDLESQTDQSQEVSGVQKNKAENEDEDDDDNEEADEEGEEEEDEEEDDDDNEDEEEEEEEEDEEDEVDLEQQVKSFAKPTSKLGDRSYSGNNMLGISQASTEYPLQNLSLKTLTIPRSKGSIL